MRRYAKYIIGPLLVLTGIAIAAAYAYALWHGTADGWSATGLAGSVFFVTVGVLVMGWGGVFDDLPDIDAGAFSLSGDDDCDHDGSQ